VFPTPFAEEAQTQKGHRNIQIKGDTFSQLFLISCMLSSLSTGQETFFFSEFHILFYFTFQKYLVEKYDKGRSRAGKPVSKSYGDLGRHLSSIQQAQFEVNLPDHAQHGWEAIWGWGVRDDSQRWIIRFSFHRADHFCASSSSAIKAP